MATVQDVSELFAVLGDPTRMRIASVLAQHELSVAELTELLGVAQSRVSTQLARLRGAGVLRDRKAGTSTFYAVREEGLSDPVRGALDLATRSCDERALEADRARATALVKRREGERAWPDAVAGQMERHYSPGRTWESMARAFLLLADLGDVLDAGCGDGTIAALIAPRSKSVTCIDRSERAVSAARERLGELAKVSTGDVEALAFPDRSFDVVLLFHVLASTRDPDRALAESARVLRPGGRLLAITLDRHEHLEVTSPYGHVHAGFRPKKLATSLEKAGLAVDHCAVTSRERREPGFQVVTALAHKPASRGSK
jgi:SAM-dependent methyltransferase/predicted transcriptional regulator